MPDIIDSLVDILMRVATGKVTSDHNGSFYPDDVLFANKLLQRTIRVDEFTINQDSSVLRSLIESLCARDEDLCAWTQVKITLLGEDVFSTHLWITNQTLRR